MSSADFWTRPDRFGTLARFALMDRVKAATETADALRGRLARYARSSRPYSAELSGRLALQLHLIKEGIKDAFEDAPIELALVDRAGLRRHRRSAGDDRLVPQPRVDVSRLGRKAPHACRRIAGRRQGPTSHRSSLVSGFGAHRILSPEAGLHVFEPSEGAAGRVTARVRIGVVPLGDVPAAKERGMIVKALDAGAASEYGRAALPRRTAAGARRRRQMAHRPPRSGARWRVRSAPGRSTLVCSALLARSGLQFMTTTRVSTGVRSYKSLMSSSASRKQPNGES